MRKKESEKEKKERKWKNKCDVISFIFLRKFEIDLIDLFDINLFNYKFKYKCFLIN